MSTFKFRAEDFYRTGSGERYCSDVAYIANEILSKHLASLPVVYETISVEEKPYWLPDMRRGFIQTHKAIIFNIEEIVEKDCEHQPGEGVFLDQIHPVRTYFSKCDKCGVKLNAKWTAE